LHDERELGAIKNGIKMNVIVILQKDCKIRKTKQLGKYGRGNMYITKTPTLNR
jgi:hypothetical protein